MAIICRDNILILMITTGFGLFFSRIVEVEQILIWYFWTQLSNIELALFLGVHVNVMVSLG